MWLLLPFLIADFTVTQLLLPCPFDVDCSGDTDDGEGVGLDELAAGLRKHARALLSMELVVLCGSAARAGPRVEANDARLRAALPDTAVVRACVQHQHCYCLVDEDDDFDNDADDMIDAFTDVAGDDALSYTTSDDERDDDDE